MVSYPGINTFQDAENFLEQFLSSRWTYTLSRMNQLVAEMGHPEKKLKVIYVGGTAGKGSTSYITAYILEKSGYKVGLHMSPHLISIKERFLINRQEIPDSRFVELLNAMMPIIRNIEKLNPDRAPTYFEIIVAMMFQYFVQKKVDVAVIEVGLGGKLDATNVLTPQVSVITNVGLDHTEILGNTIRKIAIDKREIIKDSIPVVSSVTQPLVRKLLIEKSRQVNSSLSLIHRDFHVKNITPQIYSRLPFDKLHTPIKFDYQTVDRTLKNIHLSLFGAHQAINAAVAIRALQKSGLKINDRVIRYALATIEYKGRLEIVKNAHSAFLIDGAHNPMKITALSRALADHFPTMKFPTLIAVKNDKKVSEMIKILAPHVSHWFVTTLERNTDWGKRVMLSTDELARVISHEDSHKPMTVVPNLSKFLGKYTSDNPLLITGSLYLVGAVEEWNKFKA